MASEIEIEFPRKKVRYSADDGPCIESKPIVVRIGHAKQEFFVHEKLLRASSEFFDMALKKEWKEGQEAAVDMSDSKPDHFMVWVKFLYTGRVYMGEEEADDKPDKERTNFGELDTWKHLYAFGDFSRDSDFWDALIDAMIDWMNTMEKCPLRLASFIYPHTEQESTHRRMAVDVFANIWDRLDFQSEDFNDSPEFLHDVLKAIGPDLEKGVQNVTSKEWFQGMDGCKYHDHGPDKPCYKIKPAFRF